MEIVAAMPLVGKNAFRMFNPFKPYRRIEVYRAMEFAQKKLGVERLRPVPEVEVIFRQSRRPMAGLIASDEAAWYHKGKISVNGWKVHWETDPRRISMLVHECGHALFEQHALRHNTPEELRMLSRDALLCSTEGVSVYLEREKLAEMGYARSAWTSFRRFVSSSISAIKGLFSSDGQAIDHYSLGYDFFSSLAAELGVEIAFRTVTCSLPTMIEIMDHRFYLARVFPERYENLVWEALGAD